MHSIYQIVNNNTRKLYIGKTCSSFRKRWREHLSAAKNGVTTYLYDSIRKHGVDAFSIRVIDTASTPERASDIEQFYIKLFDANDPSKGYNLTLGGEGSTLTPKQKEEKSRRAKELGIKPSEATRVAAKKFRLDNPNFSPNTGYKMPEERREKISRTKIENPTTPPWLGKKFSESHIKHLSLAKTRQDVPNEEIARLYEQGLSCAAIAAQFNISAAAIQWRLNKLVTKMRLVGFQKN
jgi:group I intron endonuclease